MQTQQTHIIVNYDNPLRSDEHLQLAALLGYGQWFRQMFFFTDTKMFRLPLVYRVPWSPNTEPSILLARAAQAIAPLCREVLLGDHAIFFPPVLSPQDGDALITHLTTLRLRPPKTVVWSIHTRQVIGIDEHGVWLR
jgi:hypothetical protein